MRFWLTTLVGKVTGSVIKKNIRITNAAIGVTKDTISETLEDVQDSDPEYEVLSRLKRRSYLMAEGRARCRRRG